MSTSAANFQRAAMSARILNQPGTLYSPAFFLSIDHSLRWWLLALWIADYFKPSAQQSHPFPHPGESERIPFGQCFLDAKSDAVVLYHQPDHSIGGTYRNVYIARGRVLPDVVATLLYQPVDNNLRLLRESSQAPQLQLHADRVKPPEAIDELSQCRP